MRLTVLAFVFATAVAVVTAQGTDDSSRAPRTVWDGVYSIDQAQRGEDAYRAHCTNCHRDDLSGYNSLLLGERFMEKYREASLHLFFDKTKSTMPRNAPGTLSDEMYVDIVSYVLKMNDMPGGAGELKVADLTNVKLVGKEGPRPVPNFSLVQVVGCLVPRGNTWVVTNSTEPVRAALPQPGPEEVVVAENPPSGTATFELLSSAAYTPAKHAGRVVELRGFLIRRPKDSRINVTSLEPVGPECAPAGGQ